MTGRTLSSAGSCYHQRIIKKNSTPPKQSCDVVMAYQQALAERAPFFVPTARYLDDGGWSIMAQLHEAVGFDLQANYTVQFSGVVKPWHRRRQKSEFWICLNGNLKVSVRRENDDQEWLTIIGEQNPGVIILPSTLWHHAISQGERPATLLSYSCCDEHSNSLEAEAPAWRVAGPVIMGKNEELI